MSSVYCPLPVMKRWSSLRRTGAPIPVALTGILLGLLSLCLCSVSSSWPLTMACHGACLGRLSCWPVMLACHGGLSCWPVMLACHDGVLPLSAGGLAAIHAAARAPAIAAAPSFT